MIIAPYVHKQTNIKMQGYNEICMHKITLMCDGGEKLWIEADDINPIVDCLEVNELCLKNDIVKKDNIIFAEIDTTKTKMNSMYTYEEIEPGSEMLCWRDFIVITDSENNILIPIPEPFKNILLGCLCA